LKNANSFIAYEASLSAGWRRCRVRASGLDVLDFSIARRIRRQLDFNLSIDNLTDKHYFETQNFGGSRLRPGDPVIARIHGTPGYPITVTVGLTFRFFGK